MTGVALATRVARATLVVAASALASPAASSGPGGSSRAPQTCAVRYGGDISHAVAPLALADRVVLADLRRVPPARRKWEWSTAVLLHALVRVAPRSPHGATYVAYVRDFYAAHEHRGTPAVTSPDLAVLALPVADLQREQGTVIGRQTIARARAFFATEPVNPLGVFDHVGHHHRFRPWLPLTRRFTRPAIWVDSLVMAVLTEARLAEIDGHRDQLQRALGVPLVYAAALQSPSGLFKHAYYYERDEVAPRGGAHWLRGHAWALTTLIELIELAPDSSPERPDLISVFVHAVAGLLAQPTVEEGLWPTLLGYHGPGNRVEVSGSLLAAAALARGYRRELLDESALTAARATFAAVRRYLTAAGSTLRLGGISRATNAARRPLAYTHPLRRDTTNAGYGLAGLLLLAAELDASASAL